MRGASGPAVLSTLLAAFAVAGSAGGSPAQASLPADPRAQQLSERLDQALAGRFPLSEARMEVMGSGRPEWRSLVVFGRGVGIWNGERQFALSKKQVRALLSLLKAGDFCRMPERLGGAPGPVRQPGPAAVEVTRAVTLGLGDLSRQVAQLNRGEQSAAFEDLVGRLYASCQRSAGQGVTATDLADGLAKLAAGRLAPETFVLSVSSPQVSGVAETEPGWQVVVQGRQLEARRHSLQAGYSAPARLDLGDEDLARLIRLLIQEDVARMPANLPLQGYTDLRISVLGHALNVQARQFAGPPSEAGLRAREAFQRVRQAALDLYQRATADPGTGRQARP